MDTRPKTAVKNPILPPLRSGTARAQLFFTQKLQQFETHLSVVGHSSPLLHLKLSLRDLLLHTTSSVTFSPLIVINKLSEVSSHVLWRSRLVLSYYYNGLECRFVSCWPLGVHFWGHSGSVGFNVRIAACVPKCGTEWSEKNGIRVARPASERSLPAAACCMRCLRPSSRSRMRWRFAAFAPTLASPASFLADLH